MTATINGIPLFNALITDWDTGMYAISLVDRPAVKRDFLKFADEHKMPLYCVADEERKIVRGVIMRADFPIYRRSEEMGEHYIVFSAETIRTMAEKYLADYNQNNVTLHHIAGSFAEGINLVQYFLKDTENGINPVGFENVENGSLFAEFQIHDETLWKQIKAGTFKGFSLEGVFTLERVKENTTNSKNNMSKMQKFKEALAKLVGECFAQITTDKGVLRWETDEDLKAGDTVFYVNENGEPVKPEDGEYRTEDGKVIKVEDGKVIEIVDNRAEVDEEGAEDTPDADRLAKVEERIAEVEERIAEVERKLADKEGEAMTAVQSEVAQLREALSKVAPKGIAEKFEEQKGEATADPIKNLAKLREASLQ